METTFKVVFEGEIRSGEDLSAVKKKIAELYKVDSPKIESIFSNQPVVLKRVDELGKGMKYVAALRHAGIITKIVRTT
ncbi:hypothetical protein ACFL4M_01985 [Pseudomonadota bacterium]